MNLDHVFLDLAVTHPNPRIGQIVGIAVVRTDRKGKVLADFSSKIRPATELTDEEKDNYGEDIVDTSGDSFDVVIKRMKRVILNESKFEDSFVVIGTHAENDRTFLRNVIEDKAEVFGKRAWLDILILAWPLYHNDMISDRSFDSLCKHFKVENSAPNSAMGDCEALVRVYWALAKRYKTALGGEEILREVGGSPLESFRKMVGL